MKGTEKIIAHIQADAKAEADAIFTQTEKLCAEIRDSYAEKAREAYSERIREGVKDCEESAGNRDRLAQMENKKDILSLKQELVSKAFDRAGELLLGLPEQEYAAFLVRLAVRSAEDGIGEIIFNKTDWEKFGPAVVAAANAKLGDRGMLRLSDESGDFRGGLIVRCGNIEVNSTVDLLVERCRGEMAGQVAKILFE